MRVNIITKVIICVTTMTITGACSSNQFKASKSEREAAQKQPNTPPPGQQQQQQPSPPGQDCFEKIPPITFMIALDRSNSMAASIQGVKTNLTTMVSNLKSIRPLGATQTIQDVAVGLVLFADNPDYRELIAPTGDLTKVSAALERTTSIDDPTNNDPAEESLTAALSAFAELEKTAAAQQTITILLVISDDFGHNGGSPGNRDFDLQPLTAKAQVPGLKDFFLYDATPLVSMHPGIPNQPGSPPWASPVAEWQAVRQAWQSQGSGGNGKNIGFPFTSQGLLTAIPQDIASAVVMCSQR